MGRHQIKMSAAPDDLQFAPRRPGKILALRKRHNRIARAVNEADGNIKGQQRKGIHPTLQDRQRCSAQKSSRQLEGVAGWVAAVQCHQLRQGHLSRI